MLVKTIEAIRSKYGDNIEALSASAKDDNEKSEEYDLLQYNFTKTVTFERDDIETLALKKQIRKETTKLKSIRNSKYARGLQKVKEKQKRLEHANMILQSKYKEKGKE